MHFCISFGQLGGHIFSPHVSYFHGSKQIQLCYGGWSDTADAVFTQIDRTGQFWYSFLHEIVLAFPSAKTNSYHKCKHTDQLFCGFSWQKLLQFTKAFHAWWVLPVWFTLYFSLSKSRWKKNSPVAKIKCWHLMFLQIQIHRYVQVWRIGYAPYRHLYKTRHVMFSLWVD